MPSNAETAINTMGCHFSFFTEKNKITAKTAPCQKNEYIFSPKNASLATAIPAAAISAQDAALNQKKIFFTT